MTELEQITCHWCRAVLWDGDPNVEIREHSCAGKRAYAARVAVERLRRVIGEIKKEVRVLERTLDHLDDYVPEIEDIGLPSLTIHVEKE